MKVYCVNLNPFGENEPGYRKIKRECISACMKSLFRRRPGDAGDVETVSFAYRFKAGHEDVQQHYIESLMREAGEEGAVLIFMSLDAIRVRSVESTCAMLQRCVQRYHATVFLPFLSMKKPFDEYWKEFLVFAHDDGEYIPRRVVAGASAPKELGRFIEEHRGYRDFVSASDLEKYTGVRVESIRSRTGQYDPNRRGRPITQEEIDEIAEIRKRHIDNILRMVETFPD